MCIRDSLNSNIGGAVRNVVDQFRNQDGTNGNGITNFVSSVFGDNNGPAPPQVNNNGGFVQQPQFNNGPAPPQGSFTQQQQFGAPQMG